MNIILEYIEDIIRGVYREEAQKYLSFFNGDCGRVVMTITIPYTLHLNMKDQYFNDYIKQLRYLINERMDRYGFELDKDYTINVIRTE
jgi:hypothetical protein